MRNRFGTTGPLAAVLVGCGSASPLTGSARPGPGRASTGRRAAAGLGVTARCGASAVSDARPPPCTVLSHALRRRLSCHSGVNDGLTHSPSGSSSNNQISLALAIDLASICLSTLKCLFSRQKDNRPVLAQNFLLYVVTRTKFTPGLDPGISKLNENYTHNNPKSDPYSSFT